MRIFGGRFKRRQIKTPIGHLTRPTTGRARESAFNLIEARMSINSTQVLDLFAGSGALGFEALSRGAEHVTFVEIDSRVISVARENAEDLGVEDMCSFVRADALVYLSRHIDRKFDLVFADPPYHFPSVALLPELVLPHVAEGGLFVLEHDDRISLTHHPSLDTARPYGKTVVSVFSATAEDDGNQTDSSDASHR